MEKEIKLIPGKKYTIKYTKKFCNISNDEEEKFKEKPLEVIFVGSIIIDTERLGEVKRNVFVFNNGDGVVYIMFDAYDIDYIVEKTYNEEQVKELLNKCWIQATRKANSPFTEDGFSNFIDKNLNK